MSLPESDARTDRLQLASRCTDLEGALGEDGMLFDFGEIKPWIKHTLDSGLDHTLVVHAGARCKHY